MRGDRLGSDRELHRNLSIGAARGNERSHLELTSCQWGPRLFAHASAAELVYAPRAGGTLQLVALEYVVFADAWAAEHGSATPTIFGQPLTLVPDGNRYEIPAFWQRHIWLYEDNEAGLFADFNPAVTC